MRTDATPIATQLSTSSTRPASSSCPSATTGKGAPRAAVESAEVSRGAQASQLAAACLQQLVLDAAFPCEVVPLVPQRVEEGSVGWQRRRLDAGHR